MSIRIAHLSDPHFGGENSDAVEAVVDAVATLAPTLTVVTGDLTLNGAAQEFKAAQAWLQRLPPARIVTPGNHDTPYWNPFLRVLRPFSRYRRYIGEPMQSAFDVPGLSARALNSARGFQGRLDWSKGALHVEALRAIEWGNADALNLFSCHHPLVDLPGAPVRGGVRRGAKAVSVLVQRNVELVLSGHVHVPFVSPLTGSAERSYAIGAGTLSLRTRGVPASFSTILVEDDAFEVTAQVWSGSQFQPLQTWVVPRREP